MSIDPNGGLITQDVADWLAARVSFPVLAGPYMPELPDRIGVITRTGGPGLRYEATFDAITLQLRVRGPQGDPSTSAQAEAERMAWQADAVLLGAGMGEIGGVHTLGFGRTGSPPTAEEQDPRVLAANYLVLAASAVI